MRSCQKTTRKKWKDLNNNYEGLKISIKLTILVRLIMFVCIVSLTLLKQIMEGAAIWGWWIWMYKSTVHYCSEKLELQQRSLCPFPDLNLCSSAVGENIQSYQEGTGNTWVGRELLDWQWGCLGIHCKWY